MESIKQARKKWSAQAMMKGELQTKVMIRSSRIKNTELKNKVKELELIMRHIMILGLRSLNLRIKPLDHD